MKKVLLLILSQIFLISFKIDCKQTQIDDKSNQEEIIQELLVLLQQIKQLQELQKDLEYLSQLRSKFI